MNGLSFRVVPAGHVVVPRHPGRQVAVVTDEVIVMDGDNLLMTQSVADKLRQTLLYHQVQGLRYDASEYQTAQAKAGNTPAGYRYEYSVVDETPSGRMSSSAPQPQRLPRQESPIRTLLSTSSHDRLPEDSDERRYMVFETSPDSDLHTQGLPEGWMQATGHTDFLHDEERRYFAFDPAQKDEPPVVYFPHHGPAPWALYPDWRPNPNTPSQSVTINAGPSKSTVGDYVRAIFDILDETARYDWRDNPLIPINNRAERRKLLSNRDANAHKPEKDYVRYNKRPKP